MKDYLIENEDFRYIDFKDSQITGIQLITPRKFNEVVYHYGKVRVLENENESEAKIEFTYTIVHPGNSEYDIDELNENEELHDIMGRILNSILWARIQEEISLHNPSEFK